MPTTSPSCLFMITLVAGSLRRSAFMRRQRYWPEISLFLLSCVHVLSRSYVLFLIIFRIDVCAATGGHVHQTGVNIEMLVLVTKSKGNVHTHQKQRSVHCPCQGTLDNASARAKIGGSCDQAKGSAQQSLRGASSRMKLGLILKRNDVCLGRKTVG